MNDHICFVESIGFHCDPLRNVCILTALLTVNFKTQISKDFPLEEPVKSVSGNRLLVIELVAL